MRSFPTASSSLVSQYKLSRVPHVISVSLTITAILLGTFFRLNHIDSKIYWLDESFTALSLSANSRSDLKQELITGKVVKKETIDRFQFPSPATNYQGTINGLIEDEPQHTPGYFLAARIWLQAFGNSIFQVRFFSALVGILSLPLMYLLVMELFEQPIVASLATTFFAVSPFHVLYSQEARPFSLWTLITIVSCLALLKAQKKQSIISWLLYGFSMVISCYTFLFSLLTFFAHFIYVIFSEKFKFNKNTFGFVLAGIVTVTGFFPWILVLLKHPPSNYTSFPANSFLKYPKAWVRNLSLSFVDFNINTNSNKVIFSLYLIYILLIFAILTYAYFFLTTNSKKKPLWFLASLLVAPALILLLRDFGKGGQMTMRANYLIPSLLSLQIMVAYLFGNKLVEEKGKLRSVWKSLISLFLLVAITSSTTMTFSNTWWIKDQENIHHQLADIINQVEQPLIVSDVLTDDEFIRPISLSHYTKENTKFAFFFEPQEGESWQNFSSLEDYKNIFLYDPSQSLQSHLVKNLGYSIEPLFSQAEFFCNCPYEIFFRLKRDKT